MLLLPIVLALAVSATVAEMNLLYEWKKVDFDWLSPAERQTAIDSGSYKPENIFILDVDRAKDGRVFVTTAGGDGVPATLSTVTGKTDPSGSPLLAPYPDWSWQRRADCKGISNVQRIAIDKCDRLWALDEGTTGENHERICPAKLLVFDLFTNELLEKMEIPEDADDPWNESNGSQSNLVAIPEGTGCKDTWLHVALATRTQSVIAYRRQLFPMWHRKVRLHGWYVTPFDSKFEGGERFNYTMGFGASVMNPSDWVPNVLDETNYQLWLSKFLPKRNFPFRSSSTGISENGILLFGSNETASIGCWNVYSRAIDENVVELVRDGERLRGISSVKVIPGESVEELWVMSNRHQRAESNDRNFDEVNFRILTAPVTTLVSGTKCATPDVKWQR